jgi:hypothetical protein
MEELDGDTTQELSAIAVRSFDDGDMPGLYSQFQELLARSRKLEKANDEQKLNVTELKETHKKRIAELKDKHAIAMNGMKTKHSLAMANLKSKLKEQHTKALTKCKIKLKNTHKAELAAKESATVVAEQFRSALDEISKAKEKSIVQPSPPSPPANQGLVSMKEYHNCTVELLKVVGETVIPASQGHRTEARSKKKFCVQCGSPNGAGIFCAGCGCKV